MQPIDGKALAGAGLGAQSWIIPFFPLSRVLPKAPPWSFKDALKYTEKRAL